MGKKISCQRSPDKNDANGTSGNSNDKSLPCKTIGYNQDRWCIDKNKGY